jgi:Xaa-Pro aminopeptidase
MQRAMMQRFEESTHPSFGTRHVPLIREAMKGQGVDAWIVPHTDEYQNEYLPACNERLAWATGFTGSAGAAVILQQEAAIFVDGRYTLQVRDQVDTGVFEIRHLIDDGIAAYLEEKAGPGRIVGYDPRLHSPAELETLETAVRKGGGVLKAANANPLDEAWRDRPPQPTAPVVPHDLAYAGESSQAKRLRIAASLRECGAAAALLTAPPSIAWLFNIRGGDVERSPLALGQAVLNADGTARLFLAPEKISREIESWLGDGVRLEAPDELPAALRDLAGRRVLIDPAQSSSWYFEAASRAGIEVVRRDDPCAMPRACKNAVEIAGAKSAHVRDGVALTRFLHWVATAADLAQFDEVDVARKLESFRTETGVLKDISFDTIAAAGSHGALPHYRPTRRLAKRIEPGSLLLVDSGAQYFDGTTDVTRTVAIGEPTAEMRERFTAVLAGHLALARVLFPVGTTGSALDALARTPLWTRGLDYDHGTGHGVGSYLGVHEGPQRIAKAPNTVALRPGMIVSNEPGYYKAGEYGIRIENLQYVTEPRAVPGGDRPMLGFETLTFAPIDRRLIVREQLTAAERFQLDEYHARTLAVIGAGLPEPSRSWLLSACAPI